MARQESARTRPSLLLRLRDQNDKDAWGQFVDLYAPLIYDYGRKNGLQDADATDVAQEVLKAVFVAIGRFDYDTRRGSFRGWLFTITRNRLRNYLATNRRHPAGSGDTAMNELLRQQPQTEPDEETWIQHYQWRQFLWAAKQLRSRFKQHTWDAFWQTTVRNRSAKSVAEELGMSIGALYVARSRILAQVRQHIEELGE